MKDGLRASVFPLDITRAARRYYADRHPERRGERLQVRTQAAFALLFILKQRKETSTHIASSRDYN